MKYNKAQAKKLQAAVDKDVAKEADSLKEASSAEERAASIRATITQLTATKAEEETKLDEIMVNLQEGQCLGQYSHGWASWLLWKNELQLQL